MENGLVLLNLLVIAKYLLQIMQKRQMVRNVFW